MRYDIYIYIYVIRRLKVKGVPEMFITIPGNLMGNSGITHSGDDELMTVSGVSLS